MEGNKTGRYNVIIHLRQPLYFAFLSQMSDLALQVVGCLGPLDLHVIGKHCVLMESLPVVLLAGQGLSVPGRHQVNHVRGELVLATGHQRPLFILLVTGQPAGLQAVEETRVVRDTSDPDVLPFLLQVGVFIVVLQKYRRMDLFVAYFLLSVSCFYVCYISYIQ